MSNLTSLFSEDATERLVVTASEILCGIPDNDCLANAFLSAILKINVKRDIDLMANLARIIWTRDSQSLKLMRVCL